jgi:hypothetical protein
MVLSLALRFAVVLLFLAVFLRRPKLLSGLGLLTVTSAVLLDTFLGTCGREETIDELGFFFYIITGILFGGAAIWLWGTLRPLLNRSSEATAQAPLGGHTVVASEPTLLSTGKTCTSKSGSGWDRKMCSTSCLT